jgi:hypothetical protein
VFAGLKRLKNLDIFLEKKCGREYVAYRNWFWKKFWDALFEVEFGFNPAMFVISDNVLEP